MIIRPAIIQDIPAILKIEQQAEAAAHWKEEDYRQVFVKDMPRRSVVVAEDETGVQAFSVIRLLQQECEIENLVVAPPMRQRGLGKQLLKNVVNLARSKGAISIFLEVREGNEAARALYNKLGFSESGRRQTYYHNPEEDAILYRL